MPSEYANPLYDEVWALSLALNNSLSDLDRFNLSLKHYQYNMSSITDIVESHLQNVHFSGVTGNIAFNSYRETHVPVLLYQIRNGSEVLIGKYSGLDDNFTLLNNSPINFPNDTFDIRYSLIPLPVAILFYTSSGIISIFITLTLILMFTVVYNEPEVKATSPWLTILIFIGGYFNIASSILLITHQSWLFDEAPYLVLCTISSWLAYCGINLINVTVLVKLVRVYRVFTHFGRMKKTWRNKYLFFVILGLAMIVPTVVTATTAIADPYKYEKIDNFMYNTNPPINLICLDCAQNLISTSVIIAYTITIVLFLISFAVLTRKVDRKDFKDTKKILAFVFILTISVGTLLPIVIIFEKFKNANLSNIFLSILIQFETVISVGMLVMPKVYGALYRRAELKSVKKIQDSIKNTTTTIINLSPIKRPVNHRD
jgi:gamma-aminobutyric acid type B receptor